MLFEQQTITFFNIHVENISFFFIQEERMNLQRYLSTKTLPTLDTYFVPPF